MRIALVAERRLSLPWGRPGLSDASFVPIVCDVAGGGIVPASEATASYRRARAALKPGGSGDVGPYGEDGAQWARKAWLARWIEGVRRASWRLSWTARRAYFCPIAACVACLRFLD